MIESPHAGGQEGKEDHDEKTDYCRELETL